ncbi:UDP-N-acetylglucosamine 4,6-dehydratase (inverting) [Asticcacaulis benevestitus]|uniref:Flagellin modification protein FlmA n=1 Tax=Asticcacaulis benevestitus DSM 16100 = ATCC BAA-896 TaxID=1121022 RepID=V4Q164_9CAUL|nr:UDP-N-acetylglucosamine 4,6-dehydratase (inverting) [Asticcacaulis benevestitus]ESQ93439.1 flagellin modification protein FlmA [Asticcacaulis benevestitus DSM 16100 = ATCC BAA-896]
MTALLHRDFSPQTDPVKNKVVLITGGTGSFGRRMVQTLLETYDPRKVIILSRDELKQYEMKNELEERFDKVKMSKMRFFLGDVRDRDRLNMAFRGVDLVIHAAALKQVPAAEYNPSECIATNINGAENVVAAAFAAHVKKVVALSTDKACSPINLYGATKLASDKIFVAANNMSGDIGTRFCVVRYGNVVGSRGSVVPFFKRLLEKGATDLPITDPRMTRFWISLDQGVAFVLSCLELTQGGEIFVPKIPATLVTDLATAMAPEATQTVIGIRPGEKLHEMMISADDSRSTYELDDRYVIEPEFAEYTRKSFSKVRGIRKVDEGFSYASDNNEERLDATGIKDMMKAYLS